MKEITRIHIAKVAYDAEIEAKKELEKYLRTLEAYSDDAEIIDDIEIRITEILTERGVNKNGVITESDVNALKEQLGEPKDFMGDGDMAVGPDEIERVGASPRKLFRDVDNAVVGGVMSGIGAFFGINPVWIRLLFIVLAFASFGTALLVYIVLWIVVPAARTAADKLQMTGRPVTIASIREINENEVARPDRVATGRRVLTAIAGTFLAIGAALSLVAVIGVTFGVSFHDRAYLAWDKEDSGFLIAAFVLAVVSGLLLAVLFVLGAYASFSQKLTRRVMISSVIVIVVGLASFGTAIGLAQYGATLQRQAIEENTHTVSVTMPMIAKAVTSLNVSAPHFNVDYIVATGNPRAEMRVVTEKGQPLPKVAPKVEGSKLIIEVSKEEAQRVCYWPGCDGSQQNITIYGPELRGIEAQSESYVTYDGENQQDLTIFAKKDANVTLKSGLIDTLNAVADDESSLSTADASVSHAKLSVSSNANVNLGTVQTLDITHTGACPAGRQSVVDLWNASSVTVNGVPQPIKTTNLPCLVLTIEGEDSDRS